MNRIYIILFVLQSCLSVEAQLCTGSLGDPVVNITFGSGSNPGAGIPVTNYAYSGSNCPNDGQYSVLNSISGCFNSSWHDLSEDHTPGDVNGYMMIVNASFNTGDFYLDSVTQLCENTTYEFASWILNVLRPSACQGNGIRTNVTFSIETLNGTKLGTYNTGDIQHSGFPTWQQYGLFFTTPPGVSSIMLRITNNAPGGCGNDIALDDITFRPCGPMVSAGLIAGGSGSVAEFCEGQTSNLTISATISSGYTNPEYRWQSTTDSGSSWKDIPGATSTTYTTPLPISGTTQYRLAVAQAGNIQSPNCRIVSNVITSKVNPLPVTAAGNNGPACEKSMVILKVNDGAQFSWTGPNGFTSSQQQPQLSAEFNAIGQYYVTATSAAGCVKKDSTFLQIVANPIASINADQTICEGKTALLQAGGGALYQWSPAISLSNSTIASPVAYPIDTTKYKVIVLTPEGCKDSAFVTINVLKRPRAFAGQDKKIFEGESVTLEGAASGAPYSFSWSPATSVNNSTVLRPLVSPLSDITYTLSVQSMQGCGIATDQVFVRVYKKVTVPNAFSPNGDGINDSWQIQALNTYPESITEVHNRYGQLVFRSAGYSSPWNGTYNNKPLPAGTYYYVINLKNETPLLTGWVFIVR